LAAFARRERQGRSRARDFPELERAAGWPIEATHAELDVRTKRGSRRIGAAKRGGPRQGRESDAAFVIPGVAAAVGVVQRLYVAGRGGKLIAVGEEEFVVLICAQRANVEMTVLRRAFQAEERNDKNG